MGEQNQEMESLIENVMSDKLGEKFTNYRFICLSHEGADVHQSPASLVLLEKNSQMTSGIPSQMRPRLSEVYVTYAPISEILYGIRMPKNISARSTRELDTSVGTTYKRRLALPNTSRNHTCWALNTRTTADNNTDGHPHYCDVIMGAMASQITNLTIVYSTVHSGADNRKHQSSASLPFAGKSPVTGDNKTWDEIT